MVNDLTLCGVQVPRSDQYGVRGNELSPDCGALAWAWDQVPVRAALPGTIQPRSLNLNPPHTRNSRYLLIGRHEVFQLHRREQRFLHLSPTVMNDIANAPLATPVLTVEKFNSLLGSSLASATVAVLGYGLWARVPIIAARRDRDAVGRNESTTQSSAPVASMPVACRPGGYGAPPVKASVRARPHTSQGGPACWSTTTQGGSLLTGNASRKVACSENRRRSIVFSNCCSNARWPTPHRRKSRLRKRSSANPSMWILRLMQPSGCTSTGYERNSRNCHRTSMANAWPFRAANIGSSSFRRLRPVQTIAPRRHAA
ncbi:hypothetical protein BVI434_160019 [Burkholderia vietnamiensis]|nr:hypothetical protein BVI434_160019 [Burkholderia vietnamiensis]